MKVQHTRVRLAFLYLLLLSFSCRENKSSADPRLPDNPSAIDDGEQPAQDPLLDASVLSQNGVFRAQIDWSPALEAGTLANSATLRVLDAQGQKTAASLKSFKLFMPAMGHGSIKTDKLTFQPSADDPGLWTITNIYFSMGGAAGEWVVDLEVELNGQLDKVRLSVDHEVSQ